MEIRSCRPNHARTPTALAVGVDTRSWRGAHTTDATIPTALAVGVDTRSWRGAHTADVTIPTALAVGVDTQSWRGANTELSVWYGVEYLRGYTKKSLQQETEF